MSGSIFLIVVVSIVLLRIGWRLTRKNRLGAGAQTYKQKKPLTPWQRKFYTIWVFFMINMKRLFRDRTALFFTFLFPLIFLFVFGGIFSKNNSSSFNVAIINESHSQFAAQFVRQAESQKSLKVDKTVTNFADANEKMGRGELDATIELPPSFGNVKNGVPSGQAIVHYTENNQEAAQTLTSVLQAEFRQINAKIVKTTTPFTVVARQTNERSLSTFDYTFTGLIGFAILGAGIFGPMNVFPELKKMGILRRLHTTPLRVWQYFLSTMVGNAVIGLMSLAVMFVVAIAVFHLKVVGNYVELALFLAFGIVEVLGIGLALGGWAKNERQVAPLGNIIVFPMMFLTGVFFPRFLMPQWLQNITTYMPLTPVIDGARLIATEGKSLLDLGPQLGIMAVWLVIIYAIAFRVFRWE
jgi:ABC-2 type transport system permease protein